MSLLKAMQPGHAYSRGDLALLTKLSIAKVENRLTALLVQERVVVVRKGERVLFQKKVGA